MIELANPSDAEVMHRIYREAISDRVYANCDTENDDWRAFAATHFGDPRFGCYVDRAPDGSITGFGALKVFSSRRLDPHVAEVAVYIDRPHRSRGLGIRLLRRLIEHAKEAKFHSLVAIILGRNSASIRGCKFCGFDECVVLPHVAQLYEDDQDIIWLQRVLSR